MLFLARYSSFSFTYYLRFRKVSFSIGAVTAVFHDVLIVLAVFSITYSFMPFDMEIGQSFIAAILTVVGYSLNDTVVIFDRIREFTGKHPNWKYSEVVDKALELYFRKNHQYISHHIISDASDLSVRRRFY